MPLSIVACEHMFSQVNLVQKSQRHRFTGVKAHMFGEGGHHASQNKNCTTFEPTKSMEDKMNQYIYAKLQDILSQYPLRRA